MKIGTFDIVSPVFLAPMAGTSDKPFRMLAKEFGAGLATSEMVVLQQQLLKTSKSQYRLNFEDEQEPISVQIAGTTPEQIAEYIKIAQELGAQIIDINMGCPVKKVCKKLAGSALMADEALVKDILTTAVSVANIPITLKTRTGTDRENKNVAVIAQIARDSGVEMLTIHGRTKADKYNGDAEYDTIKNVVENTDIPVVVNGDITSGEKAKYALDYTGAQAVMIGRASCGHPWIIKQIKEYLATGNWIEFSEKKKIILQHIDDIYNFYPEKVADNISNKHIKWYLTHNGLGQYCKQILTLHNEQKRETLHHILDTSSL